MQRFFGVSQDINGNAIPAVTVTVNLAGTGTLATLFSDNSFTPLVNPFTSNTDGTYLFYTRDGRYDIVLTKTGFTFTSSETADALLEDRTSVISPAQIISNQNDYSPTNGANVSIWRLNSDATRSITGIAAPAANASQRKLVLINTGSFSINLVNASGSSAVGNKFTCANGRDYALFPNDQIELVYDTSSAVWRVPRQFSRVLSQVGVGTTISNSAAATSIFSATVSGGLFGTGSSLRFTVNAKYTNATGLNDTGTITLTYGGSAIVAASFVTLANGAADRPYRAVVTGAANAATNAQTGLMQISAFDGGTSNMSRGAIAVDSTVDQTFSATMTLGTASNNLTFTRESAILEWLP